MSLSFIDKSSFFRAAQLDTLFLFSRPLYHFYLFLCLYKVVSQVLKIIQLERQTRETSFSVNPICLLNRHIIPLLNYRVVVWQVPHWTNYTSPSFLEIICVSTLPAKVHLGLFKKVCTRAQSSGNLTWCHKGHWYSLVSTAQPDWMSPLTVLAGDHKQRG